MTHDVDKKFQCTICEKLFSTQNSLRSHQAKLHSHEKLYELIPILREGAIYSDESLSPENLSARGVIELAVFDELSESSLWQEVVAREGMSERDRELGFLSLALLKKRYRDISDEALKDRYEVLRSFCGS